VSFNPASRATKPRDFNQLAIAAFMRRTGEQPYNLGWRTAGAPRRGRLPPEGRTEMLSRRHPRGPILYDGWHSDAASMFRMLAARWRPVVPSLQNDDTGGWDHDQPERHKRLPTYWSPWQLIK